MERQQEKPKGLPPVVFAANVRLLMRYNVFQVLIVHFEWQIDFRLEGAQDKGRADIFAQVDVLPKNNRFADLTPQTPKTDDSIESQDRNAGNPQNGENRYNRSLPSSLMTFSSPSEIGSLPAPIAAS